MEFSPIVALMKEHGAPMTRDEYLNWNHLGKSKKVSAEEESELPRRFAYPVVSHEELPPRKEVKDDGKGAPADFGGAVFPNPENIKLQLDTDQPSVESMEMSGGATMRPEPSKGNAQMDISNPQKNQIEPDPMVPREQ